MTKTKFTADTLHISVHGTFERDADILPPHVQWEESGYNRQYCKEFDLMVHYGVGGYYPDSAKAILLKWTVRNKYPHLADRIETSVIRLYNGEHRRYFPIKAKKKRMSILALSEAHFIIFGVKPTREMLGMAVLHRNLDKYIEKIDNKLMVRTIAL